MSSEREHRTDWEHLVFLAIVLIFLVWYLWTATAASPTFSNLILIAPIGAVAGILALYIGAVETFGHTAVMKAAAFGQGAAAETAPSRFRAGSLTTIGLLMVLFGLFVVAIPYVGFDVATFVFVLATLWLLGERRVLFSLSLALGIAAALSIAALTLLTFPMPLAIARSLWRAL
jgi:putative tricarboxylic transport membrane protein